MKLDNRGWGLKEMLILSSIILFFLLIAAIVAGSFAKELKDSKPVPEVEESTPVERPEETPVDYDYYYLLEKDLETATENYINDLGTNLDNGSVNIYLNNLIDNGYITTMVDKSTGNYCNGYGKAYKKENAVIIKGYIKCDEYKTEGYID